MSVFSLVGAMLLAGSSNALTPSEKPEVHPQVTTYRCTLADGCTPKTNFLVADALSHRVYQRDNPEENCGNWGNAPPADVCPDEETCHEACMIDGMSLEDYARQGVITYDTSVYLTMINHLGDQVSPRVYLLDEEDFDYEMLYLNGQEFSFEVDMESLPCGMNSALYTDEMYVDGNRGELNPTGATYGQGYCDAQCYTTPFINGIGAPHRSRRSRRGFDFTIFLTAFRKFSVSSRKSRSSCFSVLILSEQIFNVICPSTARCRRGFDFTIFLTQCCTTMFVSG